MDSIDTAFIKQFESEVHMAYQRMGSKLRNTVRTSGNVRGSVVRFQKIGTGSASTKSRNGSVTPMELVHTTVEATMADFYAAEYIDKLDELKTNYMCWSLGSSKYFLSHGLKKLDPREVEKGD